MTELNKIDGAPRAESRSQSAVIDEAAISRLTDLIDFELARNDAAEGKSGLTNWALKGVLGATIWLLLDVLKAGTISWVLVAYVLLFASLIEDLMRDLRAFLDSELKLLQRLPGFFAHQTLA